MDTKRSAYAPALKPFSQETLDEFAQLTDPSAYAPPVVRMRTEIVYARLTEDGIRHKALWRKLHVEKVALDKAIPAYEQRLRELCSTYPEYSVLRMAHAFADMGARPAQVAEHISTSTKLLADIARRVVLKKCMDELSAMVSLLVQAQCRNRAGPVAIDQYWDIFRAHRGAWEGRNIEVLYEL